MSNLQYSIPIGTRIEIQLADGGFAKSGTHPTIITTRKRLTVNQLSPNRKEAGRVTFLRGNLLITVHEKDLVRLGKGPYHVGIKHHQQLGKSATNVASLNY